MSGRGFLGLAKSASPRLHAAAPLGQETWTGDYEKIPSLSVLYSQKGRGHEVNRCLGWQEVWSFSRDVVVFKPESYGDYIDAHPQFRFRSHRNGRAVEDLARPGPYRRLCDPERRAGPRGPANGHRRRARHPRTLSPSECQRSPDLPGDGAELRIQESHLLWRDPEENLRRHPLAGRTCPRHEGVPGIHSAPNQGRRDGSAGQTHRSHLSWCAGGGSVPHGSGRVRAFWKEDDRVDETAGADRVAADQDPAWQLLSNLSADDGRRRGQADSGESPEFPSRAPGRHA